MKNKIKNQIYDFETEKSESTHELKYLNILLQKNKK